jgi:hypothetical protein
MNMASGIPKFAPWFVLEADNNPYVQDDTIFIRVIVDFDNIPLELMPDVIPINLALPIHKQHDIEREMLATHRRDFN